MRAGVWVALRPKLIQNWPMVTKRLLGIGLAAAGLLIVVGLLAVDWLNAGEFQGIGPVQRLGLIGGAAVFLVGLTLIPFGDKPA